MTALLTLAVPLAALLHYAAATEDCRFNGIDFSSLTNDVVDYEANDHVFDGHYEYVWNVCRPLVWSGGVCEAGTTAMCERIKDSQIVTGLYGETSQISWGIDTTERYVNDDENQGMGVVYYETLAGECSFGGAETVKSRVYFTCDRDATEAPEVAVIYESYYSCTVFVEMKTATACHALPPGARGGGKAGKTFGVVFGVLVAVVAVAFFAKLRLSAYRSGETGLWRKLKGNTTDSKSSASAATGNNNGNGNGNGNGSGYNGSMDASMEAGTSSYADTSLDLEDEEDDGSALTLTAPMGTSSAPPSPSSKILGGLGDGSGSSSKMSSYGSATRATPPRQDDGRTGEQKGLLSAI